MTRRKKALFTLVASILFFAGVEGLLRALDFSARASAPHLQFHVPEIKSAGYDVDPDVFWRLKPGFHGRVSDNHPWDVKINSHRMRGAEFDPRKAPGTVRIISMGDSSAFGWGVPEDRIYCRRVEAILNERFSGPGLRFEVLNAGVPGYSSWQGLHYLRRDLLQYQPDVILTYYGLNDLTGARFYPDKEQSLQEGTGTGSLAQRSRLYQLLHAVARRGSGTGRFDSYFAASRHFRVSPEDYRANLREMQRLAGERSCRVFFVTPIWRSPTGELFDYPFWLPERLELLEELSPVIDTFSAMKARHTESHPLYLDVAHPTQLGHEIMAEVICQALARHGAAGGRAPGARP